MTPDRTAVLRSRRVFCVLTNDELESLERRADVMDTTASALVGMLVRDFIASTEGEVTETREAAG